MERKKITYVELPHYHHLALMSSPSSLVLDIMVDNEDRRQTCLQSPFQNVIGGRSFVP